MSIGTIGVRIAFAAALFSLSMFLHANAAIRTSYVANTVIPVLYQQKDTRVAPLRLIIPRIGVNASIERVGIISDGSMGAPRSPHIVGWFALGVLPGQYGSAVIDGHAGWKDGAPAIFDNLGDLKIGDTIFVTNVQGEQISFVVWKVKRFDKDADTQKVFVSNDMRSHLNLITCTGAWDSVTQNHQERLVVFADRVL